MDIKKRLPQYLVPRYLVMGFAVAGLSCAPAAAQCVIDKDQMMEPYRYAEPSSEIVHTDSGFIFPAEIAGFRRQCEMTTDFTSDNFDIGYVKIVGDNVVEVKITIVHLVGLTAYDHYVIIRPDVLSQFSSLAVRSEGEYFVSGRPDLNAYQGIFDSEYQNTPWHFSMTAIDYGHWDARITVSYPEEINTAAQESVAELITAFQWQTPQGLTHEEPEE